MKTWKRGLLRAWLALSLLWALGALIYIVYSVTKLIDSGYASTKSILEFIVFCGIFASVAPLFVFLLGGVIVVTMEFFTSDRTKIS